MPGLGYLSTIGQALSLLLVGLLAGSMYGIWFGYDITRYSPAGFVEVHQGAVRGLNTLLPLMGLAAIVVVAVLAGAGVGVSCGRPAPPGVQPPEWPPQPTPPSTPGHRPPTPPGPGS